MLARMEAPAVDLETMRRAARLAGFSWTDAELEAIRPAVAAALALLAPLETLSLGEVEPAVQFRIV